jgi:hypothetical protein
MSHVLQNGESRLDLLVFASVRQRERDSDGIPNATGQQFFERQARLDDAVGREARLGDPEVQGHFGTSGGETLVHVYDGGGIGVLERDDVTSETQFLEETTVVKRRFHDGTWAITGMPLEELRRDRATVDADAQGTVGIPCHIDQPGNLLTNILMTLDVVKMARIVANFLHERGDAGGETVVLL